MSQLTFFSTHSGAGGACLGARAAGLLPIGGIEIDSYCVDLHRANFGDRIRHESILDTPTEELPDFDFLWTSPSCQSFSTAKTDGKELDLDIAIAHKIAEIIRVKKPKYFALENVRGYLYKPKKKGSSDLSKEDKKALNEALNKAIAKGEFSLVAPDYCETDSGDNSSREFTDSFQAIYDQLVSMGYNIHYAIYDVADYGVPQNRDRLILRASREPLRDLTPTHSKIGGLLYQPWEGWYNAIADLLPSCKRSHLTERQIQALVKKGWYGEIAKGLVVSSEYMGSNGAVGRADELPIMTVTTQSKPAAVLVEGKDSPSRDRTLRNPEKPCMTITANQGGGGRSPKAVLMQEMKILHQEIQSYEKHTGDRDHDRRERIDKLRHEAEKLTNSPKAVLVDGGNSSSTTSRDGEAPSFTITANTNKIMNRAVLIESKQHSVSQNVTRSEGEPSYIVIADQGHHPRAVIIERTGYRNDRDPMIREEDEPSQTIRAAVGCDERGGYRSPITALLENADVRALDYRCLARLQSFPNSYVWGKSSGKNCKAIGNAVPSLFAQKVIESIIGVPK